jgi:hypothetical protein
LPLALLPERDEAFLREKGFDFEVQPDSGMLCVVINQYELPAGYSPRKTDLLLRLPVGYPDAAPDMFWCDPPVVHSSGTVPVASDLRESYIGRTWQRFSRHLAGGQWRSGVDGLQNYLTLIRRDLQRNSPG